MHGRTTNMTSQVRLMDRNDPQQVEDHEVPNIIEHVDGILLDLLLVPSEREYDLILVLNVDPDEAICHGFTRTQ